MPATTARLPITLRPIAEEPLDSWLEAYANRLGVSLGEFWQHLVPDRPQQRTVRSLLAGADDDLLHRLAIAAAVPVEDVAATTPKLYARPGSDVAVFHPLAGSRWCPECLRARDGRWKAAWRHPLVYGCGEHECLLMHLCARCGQPPRLRLYQRHRPRLGCCSERSASACRTTGPVVELCGHDLRADDADRLSRSALNNLRLIEQLVARCAVGDDEAFDRLADVWLMRGPSARSARLLSPSAVADSVTSSIVYAAPERFHDKVAALATTSLGRRPAPVPVAAVGLSAKSRRIFVRARDPHMRPTDRLRYGSCTATPSVRLHDDPARIEQRARRIPSLLWPEAAFVLSGASRASVEAIRLLAPFTLLAPGSSRPLSSLAADAGGRFEQSGLSYQLGQWARSPKAAMVLRSLVELSRAIDEDPPPIDYARRAALVGERPLLDEQTWHEICRQTYRSPGQSRCLRQANAYVYELLTGADPTRWAPTVELSETESWFQYRRFCLELRHPTAELLRHQASVWLERWQLDEPLEWTPPLLLVPALDELSRAQTPVDVGVVHQLLDNKKPGEVAAELGIGLEHLRLLVIRHPRPAPPAITGRPNRRIPRVGPLAPDQLKQRLDSGATLRQLAEDLGCSRQLISRTLEESGLPTPPSGRRAIELDPDWLRDEYVTYRRPLPDLARQLGMTPTNLSRRMKQLGIPIRGRGGASHQTPASADTARQLPEPLHAALAGPNALARLDRFVSIGAHPSLTAAAHAAGTTPSVMSTQLRKLESAVGETLLERHAKGPGRPHRLTAAGEQLTAQYLAWTSGKRVTRSTSNGRSRPRG